MVRCHPMDEHSIPPKIVVKFATQPAYKAQTVASGTGARVYVAATAGICWSEQLFLCYDGPNKGCALSKQCFSHWIVGVISHAYSMINLPLTFGMKCHSTRSVSTSWAAQRGVPLGSHMCSCLMDIAKHNCQFYRVNAATPHPLGVVLLPESSKSAEGGT